MMEDYLELAGDIIRKRESGLTTIIIIYQLNEAQCTRLWRNLNAVYDCLKTNDIKDNIPLFKEFYVIVTRADEIVQECRSRRSWLKAAVLQGDLRQVLKHLAQDLNDCVHFMFQNTLVDYPQFKIDTILSQFLDKDYELYATAFKKKLQHVIVQNDLDGEEKNLIEYLLAREKSMCSTDGRPDADLPAFYKVKFEHAPSVVSLIGKGSYGVVNRVKWLGIICAQKIFSAHTDDEVLVESMREFKREVHVLAKLNSPHIVKLLCTSVKSKELYFVMEIMPMNLDRFIKKRWKNFRVPFTISAMIDIMLQIARGMEHLHEQGRIAHRDLKSLNILAAPSEVVMLCDEWYADVKLADFGLNKTLEHAFTNPTYDNMGTTKWRAPEVFKADKKIDWKKADAYSFAMVCSEVLTGQVPFSFGRISDLYARFRSGERPQLPSTCPEGLSSLLKACWDTDPSVRPSFKEIRESLMSLKYCLLNEEEAGEQNPSETLLNSTEKGTIPNHEIKI